MPRYSASEEAFKTILSPWNLVFLVAMESLFFYLLPGEPVVESVKVAFFLFACMIEFVPFTWYYRKNDPTFRYLISRRI